jgi:hypothetical protein
MSVSSESRGDGGSVQGWASFNPTWAEPQPEIRAHLWIVATGFKMEPELIF